MPNPPIQEANRYKRMQAEGFTVTDANRWWNFDEPGIGPFPTSYVDHEMTTPYFYNGVAVEAHASTRVGGGPRETGEIEFWQNGRNLEDIAASSGGRFRLTDATGSIVPYETAVQKVHDVAFTASHLPHIMDFDEYKESRAIQQGMLEKLTGQKLDLRSDYDTSYIPAARKHLADPSMTYVGKVTKVSDLVKVTGIPEPEPAKSSLPTKSLFASLMERRIAEAQSSDDSFGY